MKKQNRAFREIRKAAAAERTAWNRYSIHDRKAVTARIEKQHGQLSVAARAAELMGRYVPLPDQLRWVIRENIRWIRHCGNQNKYVPHQGARECARRLRQSGVCA